MCPVIPTSNQDVCQAKNRKRGMKFKNKSSPLKLPSQSQPNFAEMILRWSPSKIVPDTFLEENHPMTISSTFSSY
jgi:hypothetical protein